MIIKGAMKLADGGAARLKSAITAKMAETQAEPLCKVYSITLDADNHDLLHVL